MRILKLEKISYNKNIIESIYSLDQRNFSTKIILDENLINIDYLIDIYGEDSITDP